MLVVDERKDFEVDLTAYCKRQLILPVQAVHDLRKVVEDRSKLIELDHEIHGLRVAPLKARVNEHETLLLIDHENGHHRYVIYVSILDRPLENFLWPCREAVCKRKINIAIARLIMMSKSCGGAGPGVVGI